MINFTDTHTHLYLEQFDEDREAVMSDAQAAGVHRFFLPNIDSEHTESVKSLVANYPEVCFPMMGLHPCSVKEDVEAQLDHVYQELKTGQYVAVGEIGMDLYWDKTFKEQQEMAFRKQIEWAKELELPIAIHVRDAFDDTLRIVSALNDDRLRGVFHCFTGTAEQAQQIVNFGGFYLGLGGVLTFKNSGLDEQIKDIPLDYMVLETDSPYLTPTPHRGKRNESKFIPLVAEKLANVKGCSLEEISEVTEQNAKKLFGV